MIVIGDVKPAEETSSYIFSNGLVDIGKKLGATEIITLGGINSKASPVKPPVYGACTEKKYVPFHPYLIPPLTRHEAIDAILVFSDYDEYKIDQLFKLEKIDYMYWGPT